MFRRKGNVHTPTETYLPVGMFRNELFYVTGPCTTFCVPTRYGISYFLSVSKFLGERLL